MAPAKNIYLHMCRECGEYKYEDQPCYTCEKENRRMSGVKPSDVTDGWWIARLFGKDYKSAYMVIRVRLINNTGDLAVDSNHSARLEDWEFHSRIHMPDDPARAIDAGEVERLVDDVAMKARAHSPWDEDTMREYQSARAALLAAVTAAKGGR